MFFQTTILGSDYPILNTIILYIWVKHKKDDIKSNNLVIYE